MNCDFLKNGFYYLHRVYDNGDKRLFGVWVILNGKVWIIEDHEGFLEELLRNRQNLNDKSYRAIVGLAHSIWSSMLLSVIMIFTSSLQLIQYYSFGNNLTLWIGLLLPYLIIWKIGWNQSNDFKQIHFDMFYRIFNMYQLSMKT